MPIIHPTLNGTEGNIVFWLTELKFTSKVTRRIATKQEKEAPHRNSISKRMKRFKETNSAIDML
jgi:hypothetical protein